MTMPTNDTSYMQIFTSAKYFPISITCVGDPSVFIRAWLHRYVNQHSVIFIVLLSACEVVERLFLCPFQKKMTCRHFHSICVQYVAL